MLRAVVFFLSLHSLRGSTFPLVYPPVDPDSNDTHIYAALMMSFGSWNTSGNVPAINIAFDLMNNRADFFPGYKLHYILLDSQCHHTVALDALFKQLISDTQKIGILGSGCSVATEPTAEISHYYNITQVSCASASHLLANREKYRAYFQALPNAAKLSPAFVSICKQYGWRHVAIILQEENLFGETIKRLTAIFASQNITWDLRTFKSSEGPLSLGGDLFEERARIFFLAMYPAHASPIICQAYKTGLMYPRYSFITYGWYPPNWWTTVPVNCTGEQMKSVLHHGIAAIQHQFGTNVTQETTSGFSYDEYEAIYRARIAQSGFMYSRLHMQCFDGAWAFGLALNKTIAELAENTTLNTLAREVEGLNNSSVFRIEDMTYKNYIVQQTMFKYLEKTDFLGASGEVSFTDEGIRKINRLRVFQYRYDEKGEFGLVEYSSVQIPATNYSLQYYTNESDMTVWPSGIIPYDGKAVNRTVSVVLPVTIIYSFLAVAGVVLGISCFIFLIISRKKKLVRLSSPKLNIMIIIGAIIMYISVILYSLPTYGQLMTTILCNIQPRVFSIGYTLCFGTILAKMWRVYYIFTNPKPSRKAIKDWHLAIFVIVALLIDVILLGILTAFRGGRTQASLVRNYENPSDETGFLGYVTDYYTYICESHERDIWLGIVFGYKAVLQVAALFLAFGIRKVKVKGLNDAKFVGLTVYISSIIVTVQIIVSITLNHYQSIFSALFGTCIIINATVILGLLFLPQMINIYRDPEGKNIFSNKSQPSGSAMKSIDALSGSTGKEISESPFMSDEEKITALVQKIDILEQNESNTIQNYARKTSA